MEINSLIHARLERALWAFTGSRIILQGKIIQDGIIKEAHAAALGNAAQGVPSWNPGGPRASDELPAARAVPKRRRSPVFAAACMPGFGFGMENFGSVLLVLLAMLAAVALLWLLRRFQRVARRGGWVMPAHWLEAKRLSKQQERIQRQAILSSRSMPFYPQTQGRGDGRGST